MTARPAWEKAYQRFETPAQERRKFIRRLRDDSESIAGAGVERAGDLLRPRQRPDSRGGNSASRTSSASICRTRWSNGRRAVGTASSAMPAACPCCTASHDVAIVQGGLHHLPSMDDVHEALAEMHRVLRPDGRVIIIEPWMTPFLRVVHLVAERRVMRRTLEPARRVCGDDGRGASHLRGVARPPAGDPRGGERAVRHHRDPAPIRKARVHGPAQAGRGPRGLLSRSSDGPEPRVPSSFASVL